MPIYEKQLKETEVGITNMLNAIQMGILTSSTKERLEALEDQRKELQARIAEERLAKPKMKEGIRPLLAASLPQAGYDPAGAAAGTGGYLHQCHLSLR